MRRTVGAWCLLLLAGCHAVYHDVDHVICSRAAHPIDPLPPVAVEAPGQPTLPELPPPRLGPPKVDDSAEPVQPVQFAGEKPRTLSERLRLPPGLPGAATPDIKLPPITAPRAQVEAAMQKAFQPLPPLPELPAAAPGPAGQPLTLCELQKIALTNSPVVRQAVLDVEAARGAALQAGLYPNPMVGYSGEEIGDQGTAGMQGGFVEQTIKTANKLPLAQAAGLMDVRIAETELKEAEADVQTRVRAGYFAVLAARKYLDVLRELAKLTDEVYDVMLLQLRAGEVAAYEPVQIRVLALQARGQLIQAHNRYLSAWKQLAAALGVPGLPLTELAGQIDQPVPRYRYDQVLARVLTTHSDVAAAQFAVDKARFQLQLARVTPVPDVAVRVEVMRDTAMNPSQTVTNVMAGVVLPVWNRNQGNVQQAAALLQKAVEENHRVRNVLTARVAEAFERYESQRLLLALYRDEIVPSQVQAFRAAVARHAVVGERGGISYNDLVVSEQNLVGLQVNYLGTLRDLWQATVDLAGLMQTSDLFQVTETEAVAPVPDLRQLHPVGSVAPCNPLPDPALRTGDGAWPEALPPLRPKVR